MLRPVLVAVVLLAAAPARAVLPVEDCVRLALARAPSTRAATAGLQAAQARVRAARAAYWPRLIGQSQYGHAEGYDEAITNGGVTMLGLTVEASLLDGGVRAAELAAAQARLASARAVARQRRADVAFAVRSTYYAARAEQSHAAIFTRAASALADYEALLQRQVDLGLAPSSDLPRAALARETAASAVRAADAALGAAAQALAELTGVPVDAAALTDPAMPAPLLVDDDAIAQSPVLADARATAEAAHHDADAARGEGRGHLGLTADSGFLGRIDHLHVPPRRAPTDARALHADRDLRRHRHRRRRQGGAGQSGCHAAREAQTGAFAFTLDVPLPGDLFAAAVA
jgi:outer membrane protein TolC